jgi:hypothetical protein
MLRPVFVDQNVVTELRIITGVVMQFSEKDPQTGTKTALKNSQSFKMSLLSLSGLSLSVEWLRGCAFDVDRMMLLWIFTVIWRSLCLTHITNPVPNRFIFVTHPLIIWSFNLPRIPSNAIPYRPFKSWSQENEDVILDYAFYGIENGTYVDVGANDPSAMSVTKTFYNKNWRGINIEPL